MKYLQINSNTGKHIAAKNELFAGSGSPEGVVTANPGDGYFRNDGPNGAFFIKASLAGNTGWLKLQDASSGVSGPGTSVTNRAIAVWDGTSGTSITESPATIDASGNYLSSGHSEINTIRIGQLGPQYINRTVTNDFLVISGSNAVNKGAWLKLTGETATPTSRFSFNVDATEIAIVDSFGFNLKSGDLNITGGDFNIQRTETGFIQSQIRNDSNTSGAHAQLKIRTGGSLAADPILQLSVIGEDTWLMLLDNSDSGTLKFIPSGTTTVPGVIEATIAGAVTLGVPGGTQIHNVNGHLSISRELAGQTYVALTLENTTPIISQGDVQIKMITQSNDSDPNILFNTNQSGNQRAFIGLKEQSLDGELRYSLTSDNFGLATVALRWNVTGIGFLGASPTAQSTGWSVSNVTLIKTFDANNTTINELSDVVGSMMNELKTKGILGA